MNSSHVRSFSLGNLDFICVSTCLCTCVSGVLYPCICILKNRYTKNLRNPVSVEGGTVGLSAFSCLRTALGTVSEETYSVLPSFLIRLWVKETYLLQGSEFSHLILQSGHRCYITLPHDQFPSWGKSARFNSLVCLEPSEI